MMMEFSLLSKPFCYTIVPNVAMTVASTFSRLFHSHYSSTGDCQRRILLVPFLWLLFVLPWLSFFNLPCHFYPCGEVSRFLDKGNVSFFSDEEGEKNPSALWCISQMRSRRDLCSDAVVRLLLVAQNALFSSSKLMPPGCSFSNQHLNLQKTL